MWLIKYIILPAFWLQVFLEPLKEIQQMGHLQHVDVNKIFCNLQDLCEVTNIMKLALTNRPLLCCWWTLVSIVSNCIVGLFWDTIASLIGYYEVAREVKNSSSNLAHSAIRRETNLDSLATWKQKNDKHFELG